MITSPSFIRQILLGTIVRNLKICTLAVKPLSCEDLGVWELMRVIVHISFYLFFFLDMFETKYANN